MFFFQNGSLPFNKFDFMVSIFFALNLSLYRSFSLSISARLRCVSLSLSLFSFFFSLALSVLSLFFSYEKLLFVWFWLVFAPRVKLFFCLSEHLYSQGWGTGWIRIRQPRKTGSGSLQTNMVWIWPSESNMGPFSFTVESNVIGRLFLYYFWSINI